MNNSIYEVDNYGQYGLRPDIKKDITRIRDTADALHNRFKPIVEKFEKAASSFTYIDNSWRWGTGSTTVHHHHYHNQGGQPPKEKKDENLGLRIFAGIALTIAGLFLAYKLGETGNEIQTTVEGKNCVAALRNKIAGAPNDNNLQTINTFAANADEMFDNLSKYYKDKDLIPRIAMLAGIVLGIGACVLNSGGLLIGSVVFTVGGFGLILYNSGHYRNDQKQALEEIISAADTVLAYKNAQPSYNPAWSQ